MVKALCERAVLHASERVQHDSAGRTAAEIMLNHIVAAYRELRCGRLTLETVWQSLWEVRMRMEQWFHDWYGATNLMTGPEVAGLVGKAFNPHRSNEPSTGI